MYFVTNWRLIIFEGGGGRLFETDAWKTEADADVKYTRLEMQRYSKSAGQVTNITHDLRYFAW